MPITVDRIKKKKVDAEGMTFVHWERRGASPPKEASQKMVREPGVLKNTESEKSRMGEF